MIVATIGVNLLFLLNWVYMYYKASETTQDNILVSEQVPYVHGNGEDKIYRFVSGTTVGNKKVVLNPKASMWDLYLNILHNETEMPQYVQKKAVIAVKNSYNSSEEEDEDFEEDEISEASVTL